MNVAAENDVLTYLQKLILMSVTLWDSLHWICHSQGDWAWFNELAKHFWWTFIINVFFGNQLILEDIFSEWMW